MIDKGRATLSKKNGEYIYNSLTDQHLVRFLGFDAEALLNELAAGKGDGEILQFLVPVVPRAVLSSPFGDWNTRKKTCKRRSYRTYLLMRSRKLRAGGPARRLLEQENQRNAQQANDHQQPKLVDVRK